jgi:predicted P-loop ATPase
MASFIATTNDRQPLTDRTGSRRYLCVEVTGNIDTETPINYQQLYAQAVHEIENGEQYYPTKEEEEKMVSYNSQFVSTTTCELLLETYFRPAKRHKDNFMKAVDILTQLQKKVRGSDRPNMKQLTSALKAAHYEYGAIHGIRGWYAEKVND